MISLIFFFKFSVQRNQLLSYKTEYHESNDETKLLRLFFSSSVQFCRMHYLKRDATGGYSCC